MIPAARSGGLILFLLCAAGSLAAQQRGQKPPGGRPPLVFELPILDVPDNVGDGHAVPSMQQSLAVTRSWYRVVHAGIARALSGSKWTNPSIVLFDALAVYLPAGQAWLHEEWHRAIMSNRSVGSYNGTYDFPLFAGSIAVSRVRDEDMVRLKRKHPAEQVRLMEAGVEADYQFALALEKEQFYSDGMYYPWPLLWMGTANAVAYVYSHGRVIDERTDEMNQDDGTLVSARDFTGHDFTAWVYDLHRPEEPYEARGVHPSGIGIDRYIRWSDLNAEERAFLRLQGRLAFLNLLDPNLIGITGFTLGKGAQATRLNLTARHLLTSFGYTVDANIFIKRAELDLFVVVHSYFNGERWFPGIDLVYRLINSFYKRWQSSAGFHRRSWSRQTV